MLWIIKITTLSICCNFLIFNTTSKKTTPLSKSKKKCHSIHLICLIPFPVPFLEPQSSLSELCIHLDTPISSKFLSTLKKRSFRIKYKRNQCTLKSERDELWYSRIEKWVSDSLWASQMNEHRSTMEENDSITSIRESARFLRHS